MTPRLVSIYMSYVEPEDKNLLWMRPYLDKEGYELLYFGAKGWTVWIPCHTVTENPPLPPQTGSDNTDNDYESEEHPSDIERPCGCL